VISNHYLDASVQKAFLLGIPGCVEHSTFEFEEMQHARRKQRSICKAWLDISNAYTSVKHMMVQFALEWFWLPSSVIEIFFRYYNSLCVCVCTEEWKSNWFNVDIGMPQGCTASTIIFNICFQLILDLSKHFYKAQGYVMEDAGTISIEKAYADDVSITGCNPTDCQKSVNAYVLFSEVVANSNPQPEEM
jgi:Reverse transcriptase (RNA-dependent DNA polymerase)